MKKLIFCTQEVNKSNIRRENRGGVEHVIVTSYTLPPNIVMNGVLYPEEITKRDFATFNRTPATIEHPEVNGNYVLASDPQADIDFRIGAYNENAEIIEDGRVKLEKVVNVTKAMMTDKGKRLLDRIEEIENSSDARPIHTSIGALVKVDLFDEEQTEYNGFETNTPYDSIVTEMIGDHDAFLLDSSGAATPSQGTGIGINSEHLKVSEYFLTNDAKPPVKQTKDLRVNQELSFDEIRGGICKALESVYGEDYPWVVEIYDSSFIYELKGILYRSSYSVDDNGNVSVQDDKQEVVLKKQYVDKQITTNEDDSMELRDQLIAFLTQSKIEVKADISDADLVAKYNTALLAAKGDDAQIKVNQELTNTVAALTDKIGSLESQLQANAEKHIGDKIATIKACSKYSALPESALKLMANTDAEGFESMYTDSIPSASIGSTALQNNSAGIDDAMFDVYVGEK